MRIPGWNQLKLKQARVFIAGMGALGNEVAKNLALIGVGNLLLLDFDRVEYTNLNRTVLFSTKDVGSPKVVAASKSIRRLNPLTKVTAFKTTLQNLLKRQHRVLSKASILIGCLDNREARFILNHLSVKHRIPYVDGGMLNAMGSVRVSIPPYTPCLECGTPPSTYAQIGQRYRCEDVVFEDLTVKQMTVRHPTISTVTSVTAAVQSHEALKILLGIDLFRSAGIWPEGTGKPVENEVQYDCRTNGFLIQSFHRDIECYVCGTRGTSIDPVKPIMLQAAPKDKIREVQDRIRTALGIMEFSLVKGLKPFPERANVVLETRNLFQKLIHLQRLIVKSSLSESEIRELHRILQGCLESSVVAGAQETVRLGIPFDRNNIVAALNKIRNTASLLELTTHQLLPDYSSTLLEINNRVTRILNYVGDDLTVEECQLKDRDVLCAIRQRESRLCDTVIEVRLERQAEIPSQRKSMMHEKTANRAYGEEH
jgi:molybdopterin/thiamine biosynthesis adenylyltransferase